MKRLLLSLSVLSLLCPFGVTEQSANTLSAQGISNHPDSIWVRLRNNSPREGAYVEYSNDGVVWLPVGEGQTVFSSDFGEWGSEKKMYTPVLSVKGDKFYCEFLVNPKVMQVATTESKDLWLWKPQDYPVYSPADFEAKRQQLEKDYLKAVRIPYATLDALEKKIEASRFRSRQEGDNMRGDDNRFKDLDDAKYALTVNLAEKKAISPMLFGIFFVVIYIFV